MKKIFLYGPPGSGKSTVGNILAKSLAIPFVEVDAEIESEVGMTISQMVAQYGEHYFREVESGVIRRICDVENNASKHPAEIIALGGGALLRDENRRLCEACGDVVFLDVAEDILLGRLSKQDGQRPLLAGDVQTKLSNLLETRREHYASFCLRAINPALSAVDPDSFEYSEGMAWNIQKLLGYYHVTGMGAGYDVIVEQGGLKNLGKMLKLRNLKGPIAIVCDSHLATLFANDVLDSLIECGYVARLIVIQPGEEYKTIETVAGLWKGFLEAGLDRKSTVIALGGGVVGDISGFAASTYMRGCPWVVVPTSLLAMVDASLGGKTGFDLPEGKNLVGSFHPPCLVMADPDLLSTLPEAELRSGLAEVVKHGIIGDKELFHICADGYETVKKNLVNIVRRAIGVKARTIAEDPFESGVRAALNLGHTIGHAVEIASLFKLRHGEAVSIGMVAEARLAVKLGMAEAELVEQIKSNLLGLGLPVDVPDDLPRDVIFNAMRVDKKKDGSFIKFALPVAIGKVKVGVPIANLEEVL